MQLGLRIDARCEVSDEVGFLVHCVALVSGQVFLGDMESNS
jgi:hypothetical protein